jgi:hypothetical protein
VADTVPIAVRDIIRGPLLGRAGSAEQAAPWRDAAQRLRNDPQAEIEIADPPAPAPRPSVNYQLPLRAVLEQQAKARAEREAKVISEEITTREPLPPAAA